MKPDGVPLMSPWLAVKDIPASIQFYTTVLGFALQSRQVGTDGKPFHAVLALQDAMLQLGPEGGDEKSPRTRGGATMHHYLYVEKIDSVFERALDGGAMPIRGPRNEFWGDRCALIADPDGHLWMLATRIPGHDAWKEARAAINEQKKLMEE